MFHTYFFFFFSSRSRHTILQGDWSSDVCSSDLPEEATLPTARTLAGCLNAALSDELLRRPELLVFGEDVGRKGGVYNVTNGLAKRFGEIGRASCRERARVGAVEE